MAWGNSAHNARRDRPSALGIVVGVVALAAMALSSTVGAADSAVTGVVDAPAASGAPSPGSPNGVGAYVLTDAQLQARFVLNFVRFTVWPPRTFASTALPLSLCVLGGGDAYPGAFVDLNGASAGGHRIELRNIAAPEQAAGCHLLFVPDTELAHLAAAREAIGRRATLIVGESEAALDRGAMIALRLVDHHLGFVVKVGVARSCHLNFSPQMLHAAAEVIP